MNQHLQGPRRKLYLDDIRNPRTSGWDIVRNYRQFIDWINKNGLPLEISFDHDLSDFTPINGVLDFDDYQQREYTGYDCAKWLCDYCLVNNLLIPEWNVHSANIVGRERIDGIMNNYKKEIIRRLNND